MSTEITVLEPEVVGAELEKVEKSAGLSEDSAIALRGQFADHYNQIATLRAQAVQVTDPTSVIHQKAAREIRLGLKAVRCEVERVRKSLKDESLKRGKAIDGFANVLKYLCEPVEEQLEAVEKYAERQEQARIATIVAERTAALTAAECDPATLAAYNLGAMDDATFAMVLAGEKAKQAARVEAARRAEADRVERENADRIAREAAEAEAKRLRAEAAAREKAIAEEREAARVARVEAEAKAKHERDAIEAKARAEREASEAKARAERAVAAARQKEADAKLKAEREAREKAEREAAEAKRQEEARVEAERKAAEEKARAEREAQEKAARAPDREKIMAFSVAVRALTGDVPEMSTDAGLSVVAAIVPQIEKFAVWIETQASKL